MELKKYQQKTLNTLRNYLNELENVDAKYAFMHVREHPYQSNFFGNIPFVCVKIPTGGGKTVIGCHAVSEIMNSVLSHKMDRGIVMWFTPSDTIKSQTLKCFKDRNDWYRKVLDEAFDNRVRIFSNEEALSIRKSDVENNLCIIISSLDAFRKEKKIQAKYKVYQENGALLGYFEDIDDTPVLEKDEQGTNINSLANLIKINNPLIVIDEGHKTKTPLSIEFLKDLNPSFIIEYTATPRPESNVLVDIHSSELKEEEMVKIPLVLESFTQWQKAIMRGVLKREELEKEAKKSSKEYIRPIALFQAQQEKESKKKVTVDDIKEFLIKERKIPEEQIAIKTSKRNEIEGVNLFAKNCKIRYIITVSALAEGWDCSFAYVLVSVANIGSKIAVEQVIGRIIRMPYAKKKGKEALNRSYIFTSARNFNEAASQIISGLESNGYTKFDVINANDKEQKYELDVERAFKEDLKVPLLAYNEDVLSFEELIGEDFELAKQDPKFDFVTHYDLDGKAILDIKGEDKWFKSAQQILNVTYQDKIISKADLIQWLDKKLRFVVLDQSDKLKFIERALDYQLNNNSLSELSVNRYVLVKRLKDVINSLLEQYAKARFVSAIEKKKITVKAFKKFPEVITLSQEISQSFNKSYYKIVDKLNKEELAFIERIDSDALPNIKYWARNREKKDPFYIQGWKKNKFYPDFIAATKKGNLIALEWKGEDRISNEDTQYKAEIARVWEKLGEKLYFFLVNNDNVEEALIKIKEL
jgi:type III restriction enzyme